MINSWLGDQFSYGEDWAKFVILGNLKRLFFGMGEKGIRNPSRAGSHGGGRGSGEPLRLKETDTGTDTDGDNDAGTEAQGCR